VTAAARRRRIPRIEHQVHQDHFERAAVEFEHRQRLDEAQVDADGFIQQRLDQAFELAQDAGRIHALGGAQGLRTGELQQLTHRRGAAAAGA
jgi:hypothetical protein